MLPNDGRAGRGVKTSPRSFDMGFRFTTPNQDPFVRALPGDGGLGAISSGDVGGLAATPTTSASSSKLTLTCFRRATDLLPSSEATDVASDSSLSGGPGRRTLVVLPSGERELFREFFIADLAGDTDRGGGWCRCSPEPVMASREEKRADRPGLLLGWRRDD